MTYCRHDLIDLLAALEHSTKAALSESIAEAAALTGEPLPFPSADASDGVRAHLGRLQALLLDATREAARAGRAVDGLRYTVRQLSLVPVEPGSLLQLARVSRAAALDLYVAEGLDLQGMASVSALEVSLSACETRHCRFDYHGAAMGMQLLYFALGASLRSWDRQPQIYA